MEGTEKNQLTQSQLQTVDRAVSFRFLKEFKSTIPDNYTTSDVVFKVIVPATQSHKCSYASQMKNEDLGKPNYFVSHRWGCKFSFVFDLLQNFMDHNPTLKEESTFFWIDIFAINQHPGQAQQHDLSKLCDAVLTAEKTLLIMDETEPVHIFDIFGKFHVTQAQATVEQDRQMILADIQQTTGAQQMTLDVKQALLDSSVLEVSAVEKSSDIPTLIRSLINCSSLHLAAGKLPLAENYGRRSLQLAQDLYGNDHLDIAYAMFYLGEALHSQGKYSAAEELHKNALEIRKKLLEKYHPDITASMNTIAILLHRQGQYENAEKLHRETLELRKEYLGAEHPQTVTSQLNLAITLSFQKKYEEAEELHRRTLSMRKKILGEQHAEVAYSMYYLAETVFGQQRFKEAEELHMEALEMRRKLLGLEHPMIATSMDGLANSLSEQGRYYEAEELHRKTLELRTKLLGTEHPHVALSMSNLGNSLHSEGRYQEAEEMHRAALEIRQRTLGVNHPLVTQSSNDLAKAIQAQRM